MIVRMIKVGSLALGLMMAAGGILPMLAPHSGDVAFAASGDVRELADGGLFVDVPGKGAMTMRPMLATAVGGAMRYDDDATAQGALMQVMRQAGPKWLEAVAIVAASFSPDRASLISAAAMQTDPRNGLNAARAMRHVRGVRKQQILLGVHSSGNRQAYKDLRRSFRGRDEDNMLADSIGRSVGPASAQSGGKGRGVLGFDGATQPRRPLKNLP